MAIETRYYGIFHRTNTSAYHPEIYGFYRLEYDTVADKFVDPAKWDAVLKKAESLRESSPIPFGDYTIKRTDSNGKPLDRPAYGKNHVDEWMFVIDSESIIARREALAWPQPDDQMGENCPLAYGGYWIIDDGKPSPKFLFKKDAYKFAERMQREPMAVVYVKTTRPAICPTRGVCPTWCYDLAFREANADSRWPKWGKVRHIAVGAQWREDVRGVDWIDVENRNEKN